MQVSTTLAGFFRNWFEFLKPFHHLTDRQMDVIAAITYLRYKLSKKISDEELLDENVLSDASKKKVREACKLKLAHFQVIMGELKKSGVIVNGRINPRYIPRVTDEKGFQLLLYFNINDKP